MFVQWPLMSYLTNQWSTILVCNADRLKPDYFSTDLPRFPAALRMVVSGVCSLVMLSSLSQRKHWALVWAKDFIINDSLLDFGDNIFYGHGLTEVLERAATLRQRRFEYSYQSDRTSMEWLNLMPTGKRVVWEETVIFDLSTRTLVYTFDQQKLQGTSSLNLLGMD